MPISPADTIKKILGIIFCVSCAKGHSRKQILARAVFQLAFIAAFSLVIFISLGFFLGYTRTAAETKEYLGLNRNASEVVTVKMKITELSTEPPQVHLSFSIRCPPTWVDARGAALRPFILRVGEEVFSFDVDSSTLLPLAVQLSFSSGDILMYPFDEYFVAAAIDVETPDEPGADFDLSVTTVPLNGFYIQTSEQNGTNFQIGERNLAITASRSGVFKVYPIFIIVSFWTLNFIMIAFGSYFIVWGASSVDSGFAMLFPAMMFAFPAFRDTAPQSPPVGCLMDWIGFYWSMLLSVLGSIGLAVRYMVQESDEQAAVDAATAEATEKQQIENKSQKPEAKIKSAPKNSAPTSHDVAVEMPTVVDSEQSETKTKVRKRKKNKPQAPQTEANSE